MASVTYGKRIMSSVIMANETAHFIFRVLFALIGENQCFFCKKYLNKFKNWLLKDLLIINKKKH